MIFFRHSWLKIINLHLLISFSFSIKWLFYIFGFSFVSFHDFVVVLIQRVIVSQYDVLFFVIFCYVYLYVNDSDD